MSTVHPPAKRSSEKSEVLRAAVRPLLAAACILFLVVGGVAVRDARRPKDQQLATRSAIVLIEFYRARITPRLGDMVKCRYIPSCSTYGLESVKKYGGWSGGWRAAKRIGRCQPWTKQGTVDPP